MRAVLVLLACGLLNQAAAWRAADARTRTLQAGWRAAVGGALATGLILGGDLSPAVAALAPSSWDPNVQVEVLTKPAADAKSPKVGDMTAIRFSGTFNGNTFDDTFKTDQPYFYRAGLGSIMKGVDDAVIHLKVGEKVALRFGGDLSFPNGKPSSPGKPRIPAGAVVDYVVELESLPGQGDPDALILDDL